MKRTKVLLVLAALLIAALFLRASVGDLHNVQSVGGAAEQTASCMPAGGMAHLMIVWGHGLTFLPEILKAIHAVDGVHLIHQKEVRLPSLDAAIDEIYHDDKFAQGPVGKAHVAAKSKFLYKLPNAKDIHVLVMYDTAPTVKTAKINQRIVKLKWALRKRFNPKLTPDGKREINQRMVKLKWALRKRFNPKLTPDGKRDGQGVYSHNHVVHISDTDEGVDDLLKFFKLPTTGTLVKLCSV